MQMGELLGLGFGALTGWLDCARGLLRRVGIPVERLAPGDRERRAVPAPAPTSEPVAAAGGPQEMVEEAKFRLGRSAPEPAGPSSPEQLVDREQAELPHGYGVDRIVLLPRDPWWVFGYWEITPTTRVEALRTLGADAHGAREVVRVYDVTYLTFTGDNAWHSFDIEVSPGATSWYLNVGRPAASYCAEVGLRTTSGRFLPLARSNTVRTPRSSPSPDTTVRWVDLGTGGPPRETAGTWAGSRLASTAAALGGVVSSDAVPPAPGGSSDLWARPPER